MARQEQYKENNIEFITGQKTCTATFSNRKHINRIKKIYQSRSAEFDYLHENTDGSICARFPVNWIKINPGAVPGTQHIRTMTDEEKTAFVSRTQAARAAKKAKDKNN